MDLRALQYEHLKLRSEVEALTSGSQVVSNGLTVVSGAVKTAAVSVRDYGVLPSNSAQQNIANLNAMLLAFAGIQQRFYVPFGVYPITRPDVAASKGILFENMQGAEFVGDGSGVSIFQYKAFPGETGGQAATWAAGGVLLSLTKSANCTVRGIGFSCRDPSDATKLCARGVLFSSNGSGGGSAPCYSNLVTRCQFTGYADVAVQVGTYASDIDSTLDNNALTYCLLYGIDVSGNRLANYGLRVSNTNCNWFRSEKNYYAGHVTAGIEVLMHPRGFVSDHDAFTYNGSAVAPGTGTALGVIIRSTVLSAVEIRSPAIVELFQCPFLVQDGTGVASPDGDGLAATDAGAGIYIENFECSYNWDGTNTAPKILDIRGGGLVSLKNLKCGGPNPAHAGTAAVYYRPVPGTNLGPRTLITENVFLYGGAVMDVASGWGSGSAQVTWIDLGTPKADDVDGTNLVRSHVRTSDGQQIFSPGNFKTPTAVAAVPTDQVMVSGKSRVYKIDFTRTEFKAAALTADVVFETFPAFCRLKSAWCQETIAWAGTGIATITAMVGTTAGGQSAGAPNAYVKAKTVAGAAPLNFGIVAAEMGTAQDPATAYPGGDLCSTTAGGNSQLMLRLTTDVNMGTGAVTKLTAGSLTVYVEFGEGSPTG